MAILLFRKDIEVLSGLEKYKCTFSVLFNNIMQYCPLLGFKKTSMTLL